MPSLLNLLRKASQVDCDTMDAQVAEKLGPFVDCTSNQAIAYFELAKLDAPSTLHHQDLITAAKTEAVGPLSHLGASLSPEEFLVEILMVKLQLRFLQSTTGYIHVQTNPKLSYSTDATIENAKRIVEIVKVLAPTVDPKRVCVKIPATWEGLQACRILESGGIATLATTMFCMEQAALAAASHCTYIAPYVNELKVHFEPEYVDHNKAFDFCRQAQAYYLKKSCRTQVLAASLTSIHEVMQLAGVQHITIAPKLLDELAATDAAPWSGKLGEYFAQAPADNAWETTNYEALVADESAWRLAFTRSGFGTSEGKIIQAINYFSDFQEKIELLVKAHGD